MKALSTYSKTRLISKQLAIFGYKYRCIVTSQGRQIDDEVCVNIKSEDIVTIELELADKGHIGLDKKGDISVTTLQ